MPNVAVEIHPKTVEAKLDLALLDLVRIGRRLERIERKLSDLESDADRTRRLIAMYFATVARPSLEAKSQCPEIDTETKPWNRRPSEKPPRPIVSE
jgi:hypothetical protein